MRHAILVLPIVCAAMLTACQPQSPDGAPAPPPADAPRPPPEPVPAKAFTGDIDAHGTEPFWSVTIRADTITLTRPVPEPPIVVANPGPTVDDGEHAVWSANHDGKAFMVSLAKDEPCSDGMSDLSYPYVAVITLGAQTLRGCANKTGGAPREATP